MQSQNLRTQYYSSISSFSSPSLLTGSFSKEKKEKKECLVYYYLSSRVLATLQKYVNEGTTEISGLLKAVDFNKDLTIYTLGLSMDSILIGKGHPEWSTPVPMEIYKGYHFFFFHTHPNIAYENLGAYRGWPFNRDVAITFLYFLTNNVLVQFVPSREGIYAISLSAPFMQYSKTHITTQECIQEWFNLIDLVTLDYGRFDAKVKEAYGTDNPFILDKTKPEIIYFYFKTMYTLTFNRAIDIYLGLKEKRKESQTLLSHYYCFQKVEQEKDFVLFNMNFQPWEEAYAEKMFAGQIYIPSAVCPLPLEHVEPGEPILI